MIDKKYFQDILDDIKNSGLWKEERIITTPQSACIDTTKADGVLNFCANNYLGLSNDEDLKKAAIESYEKYGYGMSSVRFFTDSIVARKAFTVIYCVSAFLGSVMSADIIWQTADLALGIMTVINLCVLVRMSGEVRSETEKFLSSRLEKKQ